MIKVKFWGTRGSVPISHPEYQQFGGNTSCVTLEIDTKLIILDAGSGLKNLGDQLGQGPWEVFQFFSHFHYDHIIGLPFFKPIWNPSSHIHFISAIPEAHSELEGIFEKFIQPPFMPMNWKHVPCQKTYTTRTELPDLQISPAIQISWAPLNHPGDAYGYRFDAHGKSVCYVTDTEHTGSDLDPHILKLIQNADLVIYDAFFTNHNFIAGWGHSTWEQAVRLCQHAGAKNLAIFHHHFDATDKSLADLEKNVQAVFPHSFVARDFMTLSL